MKRLTIVVPGRPVAKPRMTRSDKWKKRPCVLQYRAWCDKARGYAEGLPPHDSIAMLTAKAFFCPPASWSRKKRRETIGRLHRQKPDVDNILKAILDCFFPSGDEGVAFVSCFKVWDMVERLELELFYSEVSAE